MNSVFEGSSKNFDDPQLLATPVRALNSSITTTLEPATRSLCHPVRHRSTPQSANVVQILQGDRCISRRASVGTLPPVGTEMEPGRTRQVDRIPLRKARREGLQSELSYRQTLCAQVRKRYQFPQDSSRVIIPSPVSQAAHNQQSPLSTSGPTPRQDSEHSSLGPSKSSE